MIKNEEDTIGEDPEVVLRDYILKDCNPKMTLAEFRRYLMAEFSDYSSDTIAGAVRLWALWFLKASALPLGWMPSGKKVGEGEEPYREWRAKNLAILLTLNGFTFDSAFATVTDFLKEHCDQEDIRGMAYMIWRDGERAKESPKVRLRVADEFRVQQMVQEMKNRKFTTLTPYKVVSGLLNLMCPDEKYLREIAFTRWFDEQELFPIEEQPPYPRTHRKLAISWRSESLRTIHFCTDDATAESLRKYDRALHRCDANENTDLWIMRVDNRWEFSEVIAYLEWLEKQPAVEPLSA